MDILGPGEAGELGHEGLHGVGKGPLGRVAGRDGVGVGAGMD